MGVSADVKKKKGEENIMQLKDVQENNIAYACIIAVYIYMYTSYCFTIIVLV